MYTDANSNIQKARLARKRFPAPVDFQNESVNLDTLKKSLSSHTRIMVNLCSIIHGDNFDIFFPLADLNLHQFLVEGRYTPLESTPSFTPKDLIEEAACLAHALHHLHYEIYIKGKHNIVLSHMDLKPDNILVICDWEHPAGNSKITD